METNNYSLSEEKRMAVKADAEKIAAYFGYNINSLSLEVINVKDAYCRGFENCYKEMKESNESLLSALTRLVDRIKENELSNHFPSAYFRAIAAIKQAEE